MEGTETGTFNEMTTLNGIPLTADQQLKAIEAYGGLDKWGGPNMAPHYAAAWAWAGNTPFQWGKQVASHLGGIRDPMVIAWPKRIKDKAVCAVNSLIVLTLHQPSWKPQACRSRAKSTASSRCQCTV